jgi:hypothetical protein
VVGIPAAFFMMTRVVSFIIDEIIGCMIFLSRHKKILLSVSILFLSYEKNSFTVNFLFLDSKKKKWYHDENTLGKEVTPLASRKSADVRSIVYAAICLALCILLPFLTGSNPSLGKSFAPMHLPVLLCGFIAGPLWGGIVGGIAPFLRTLIAGAPALYPDAIRMAAELAVYGIATGLFYRYLPKKPFGIYVSLICSQLFGRLAWGAVQFILSIFDPTLDFSTTTVFLMTFSPAVYGILIQLALIPPIVIAMQRARFISKY